MRLELRNMKVSVLISSLVSLSVAIDVAPVYPEDSDHSSSVKTITPSSVLTLTDINVPGADDQVTHFVQVSPEEGKKLSKTEISSEASHARQSAHSDFEERIRQRLQKEKQKLALKELALKSPSSRSKSRSYKLAETSEPERSSRFDSSFRDRSRSRYHHKTRDSGHTNKDSSYSSTSSRFKPSRTSYSTRNRFKSVITDRIDVVKPVLLKPSISKPRYATSTRSEIPELTFKKFERPNVKKNFLNKYFPRPNILKNKNTEQREDGHLNLENEEIRFERLLTTLDVSTSYPVELTDEYLEVATIRSPYTFNIEENEKSTRFITITKSITKTLDISPSKSFTTSTPSSSINPSPSLSSTPLFDTNSIPPPENILATTSTPYDNINLQGSSDIEFLAPITLTTSLNEATPPLKTVTETLSTVETMVKKSILPVIIGEDITSLFTLSQTYSITRIVTAVKTVPPMDLFDFNPQQNFADFDTLFEGAGSENRESLLPGELEFSDQDSFGLEGPSIVKVAPPHEFLDDLDIIGTKFDLVDQMEKHNNPDLVQLKGSAPSLESSQSLAPVAGVTPEQLLYLQLLSNPLAALGIGGGFKPQVVTESSPVLVTKPVVETSVIRLLFGAKETFTTLIQTLGVTTSTDYVLTTRTLGGGGLALPNTQLPNLAALVPSFTLVTSPVTRDTTVTQTLTEQIRITFRNVPTLTTLTSTKVVSTKVTSYVTKTQSLNPLAGLIAG